MEWKHEIFCECLNLNYSWNGNKKRNGSKTHFIKVYNDLILMHYADFDIDKTASF